MNLESDCSGSRSGPACTASSGDHALNTALYEALGHDIMVQMILDQGAHFGFIIELLAMMIKDGYESKVRLVLDQQPADCKSKLLVEAAKGGHEGLVRILFNQDPQTLNASLLEAVLAGHELVVRLLLNQGADAMATVLSIGEEGGREARIRFYRSPVLQEALAAQKSGFGNTCPLQYYTERRQRLQMLHEKFSEQNLKLKMATAQSVTSFRNLCETLKDHRKAWAYGITTLRRLCR